VEHPPGKEPECDESDCRNCQQSNEEGDDDQIGIVRRTSQSPDKRVLGNGGERETRSFVRKEPSAVHGTVLVISELPKFGLDRETPSIDDRYHEIVSTKLVGVPIVRKKIHAEEADESKAREDDIDGPRGRSVVELVIHLPRIVRKVV
jgi:hypothetical protein